MIFLDAGGVLFDTFIKKEDRIRRLLAGRGFQLTEIDAAIIKAKQNTPFFSWRIGMGNNNTAEISSETLPKNLATRN